MKPCARLSYFRSAFASPFPYLFPALPIYRAVSRFHLPLTGSYFNILYLRRFQDESSISVTRALRFMFPPVVPVFFLFPSSVIFAVRVRAPNSPTSRKCSLPFSFPSPSSFARSPCHLFHSDWGSFYSFPTFFIFSSPFVPSWFLNTRVLRYFSLLLSSFSLVGNVRRRFPSLVRSSSREGAFWTFSLSQWRFFKHAVPNISGSSALLLAVDLGEDLGAAPCESFSPKRVSRRRREQPTRDGREEEKRVEEGAAGGAAGRRHCRISLVRVSVFGAESEEFRECVVRGF